MARSIDRPGGSPIVYGFVLLVVLFGLIAGLRAISTSTDCDGRSQHWEWAPPGWVCDPVGF